VVALWIAGAAFLAYVVLGVASVPHALRAQVHVPDAPFLEHWRLFAAMVLALSGVEAVANLTGIMVDPVGKTARKTIWPVAIEVVTLNLVFALAMNALPMPVEELRRHEEDMLRVIAEHYVGSGFAAVASVVFALLLLSASSTAITGMLGIGFAMARDGELPRALGRINRFGVPAWALFAATLAPAAILTLVPDLAGLAALYAIGVVGAIALNAFCTATTKRLAMRTYERVGLLFVAAVMAAIWVTVAVSKHQGVLFASVVLGTGLVARFAMRTYRKRVRPVEKEPFPAEAPRLLLASRGDRRIVDLGLERAGEIGAAVIVSLVREASFVVVGSPAAADQGPDVELDPEATELFEYAVARAHDRNVPIRTFYAISPTPMYVIADHAVTLGVAEVHVGSSRRTKIEKVLRGSPLQELAALLPDEIQMVVHTLT
jgi:amino acid transporter